jgi:hypothetical protein
MKTETEWAIRNLELAGWFDKDSDYEGMIGQAVKKLLEEHAKEGHSGSSHFLTVNLFKKVACGEALTQEFWDERFKAYNELASKEGFAPWTPEKFEEIVMKRPSK